MILLPERSTSVDEAEVQEDARPVLIPILRDQGPDRLTVFLGNLVAAEAPVLLAGHGITESLNVAVNIFPGPLSLPDGTSVRRYQVGLIDGPGNAPHLLAAAVQVLHGLVQAYTPRKPHYPAHRRGHLLVHCRGGRSRSAIVVALWLHRFHSKRFPTLESGIEHVRQGRCMGDTYPLAPMVALAREVLARELLGGGGDGV